MFGARAAEGLRSRIVLATLVSALGARAQSNFAPTRGRFQAPEGCGTHAEFSRELERLLGTEAPSAEPRSVLLERAETGEYRLRIELRDGTRGLRHADCRTLFRSAIVIAAASHEAERRRHGDATEQAASRAERPPWILRVSAGAGAAAGPLPGVAPLFEISGGADHRRLGLTLSARYLPATVVRTPSRQGVLVTGAGARLLASYEPWPRVRIAIGAAAHLLYGEGRGARDPASDATYDIESVVELAAVPLRTESFKFEVGVGAHWAAVRPSFLITGFGEVYEVPKFGGEGLLRVVWLIP
jgi:hypothetical protein